MRKAILSFMVAVALMAPFCCYGYENSYIDTPEIWLDNENTSLINIEDKHLDGYLQYYIDSDSHTLYGHISHSGNADSSVPVFVGIEGDSFSIEFDENGIDDNDFGAGLTYQNNKNEVYFAIDFNNKDIRNNTDKLRVTIRINGVDYLVCEQIAIDIKDPIKTTKPKETTTKLQKEKAEKETTTKSISKSSSKKETTTKFKYTLEKTETSETVTEPNTENITEPVIITSSSDTDTAEAHLSSTAIILLALAVSAITVGTALIIRSHIKSKKSDDTEETAEDDTPENEIIEENPTADHMRKINLGKDLSDYDLDDLDE